MTLVILAGGKSSRMGRNKMLLPLNGKTLLERAVDEFAPHFDVAVSVADLHAYPNIAVRKIADIVPECGPVGGLLSALTALDGDVFMVAADMPFVKAELVTQALAMRKNYAVCGLDQLFAFYSRDVLPCVADAVMRGDYRMRTIWDAVPSKRIPLSDLTDGNALFNVNEPHDYERAVQTASNPLSV